MYGRTNQGFCTFDNGKDRSVAILVIFAENDNLPGAIPKNAMLLRECLKDDLHIQDFMVNIFPDQKHGFAHLSIEDEGE